MAVKSDAYIVYHNGKYLIRPAFAVVSVAGNNPKFRIRNMTDFADAEVILPSSRIKPGKENKKAARALRGQDLAEFDLAKLEERAKEGEKLMKTMEKEAQKQKELEELEGYGGLSYIR